MLPGNDPPTWLPRVTGAGPNSGDGADKRALSVVFFDLSNSSAHLHETGAEQHLDQMQNFMRMIGEQVAAHGGVVMQYLGDGAMCFFGYPRAREDDATRAISACHAVIRIWEGSEGGGRMPARAGVSSGFALFGGLRMQDGVIATGPVINTAARLLDIAAPGEVLICENSRRLARKQFRFASRGRHALRGLPGDVQVFTAERARMANTTPRGSATGTGAILGRNAELAELTAHLSALRDGGGRVVHVSGDPGIGKSRLVEAFLAQPELSDHALIRLDCRAEFSSVPFKPLRFYIEALVGARPEETESQIRTRVAALISDVWRREPADRDALLEALQYPMPEPPAADSTGQSRRNRAIQCLLSELCALAKSRGGLVLVVEDMHWIDPSLDRLLARVAQVVPTHPILMLLTSRRSDPAEWLAPPLPVAQMALHPLGRSDCRELAARVAGEGLLPPEELDRLYASTDGVPLFIEEFAAMAASRGDHLRHDAVPLTLASIVQSRFDELGAASAAFMRTGALIGQEFQIETAARAAGLDDQACADALRELSSDANIRIDQKAGRASFSHALIREAVREITAPQVQRALHGALADHFRAQLPDGDALTVAFHYAGAGCPDCACEFYCLSAERKLQSGAISEAERELGTARALIDRIPPERREAVERRILSLLGPAHMILGGPGSAPFGAVQQRALEILSPDQSDAERMATLYNCALHYWATGRFDQSQALVHRMAGAHQGGDGDIGAIAQSTMLGLLAWHQGRNRAAAEAFDRVVSAYDPARHAPLNYAFMKDFGVFGCFYAALSASVTGDVERASDMVARAETIASGLASMHDRGFAMLARFMTELLAGRLDRAQAVAAQVIEFGTRHGFPEFAAMARLVEGWCRVLGGERTLGIAEMEQGFADWAQTNFAAWQALFAAYLARAYLMVDDPAAAEGVLHRALRQINISGENQARAPLFLSLALLARHRGDASEAASLALQAREIAEAQSARHWLAEIAAEFGGEAGVR